MYSFLLAWGMFLSEVSKVTWLIIADQVGALDALGAESVILLEDFDQQDIALDITIVVEN